MTDRELLQQAQKEGFLAAVVDTQQITFDASFRPYCQQNLCGQYGANYSRPPDCGSPEEMKQRILTHKKVLVLQTRWKVADYSDVAAILDGRNAHRAGEQRLAAFLQEKDLPFLRVGASGCSLCSPCKQSLGEPCPYPQLRYSCMSAYCIHVQKLAEVCNMDYDWNQGTVSFFGMFVYD